MAAWLNGSMAEWQHGSEGAMVKWGMGEDDTRLKVQ